MKRVISYSLYGDIKKYTIGAIKNAENISVYYPDWEGWFYVGKSVQQEIKNKLILLGMKVISMDEEECPASMMWRFLAFADKNVEYAIIRDCDSRLSEREATAVNEWIDSGKSFHIMRDHPAHNVAIPGGMWGAKAEKLRDIKKLIDEWRGEKTPFADQYFLKELVYPRTYSDSIIHASFHGYENNAIPFPTKRSGYRFVGEIFDEKDIPDKYDSNDFKKEGYKKVKKLFYNIAQKFFKRKKEKTHRTGELKVVHVSTSLFSVSAASRLIEAERLRGIEAVALIKEHGRVSFPCYENKLTFGQKINYLSIRIYEKIIGKIYKIIYASFSTTYNEKTRSNQNNPWNDGILGEPIHNSINILEADIAHLHWIASGFPVIKYLYKINKPIVWTLHDVWALTAGHHCDMDCSACKNNGKNCQQFEKICSRFPSSEYLWKYKKNFYDKIKNLTIITPSNWLGDMARKSPLLKGRNVFVVPNCINTELFKQMDKNYARKILNLPLDKKVVLFSSAGGINIEYKGFDLLVKALTILKEQNKIENIHLLVIGSSKNDDLSLPFPSTFLGHVDSESMLPIIYNAADVFVGPSKQDNFPNVFVESLSCGVPGVGFDVGGIPELVLHKERGYIAKSFDTNDLAYGIYWVLNDKIRYENLSKNSRQFAEKCLSYSAVSKIHCQIYKQIISIKNKHE